MEELLRSIGFDGEDTKNFLKFYAQKGKDILPFVCKYAENEISMAEASEAIHKFADSGCTANTIDLVFAVMTAEKTKKQYEKEGISEAVFKETFSDIKCKLNESLKGGGFGLSVLWWFDGYFKLKRFALGRLQYDVLDNTAEDIAFKGGLLPKGSFALDCHIPSGKPLSRELCIDSYKKAYAYFGGKISDGILPILCDSWLLFPDYMAVFGKDSNIYKFAADFNIYSIRQTDEFCDAWRVFGMPYKGDTHKLPQDTTLQRNFVEYIKRGGKFGNGLGILLFNGEKILRKI